MVVILCVCAAHPHTIMTLPLSTSKVWRHYQSRSIFRSRDFSSTLYLILVYFLVYILEIVNIRLIFNALGSHWLVFCRKLPLTQLVHSCCIRSVILVINNFIIYEGIKPNVKLTEQLRTTLHNVMHRHVKLCPLPRLRPWLHSKVKSCMQEGLSFYPSSRAYSNHKRFFLFSSREVCYLHRSNFFCNSQNNECNHIFAFYLSKLTVPYKSCDDIKRYCRSTEAV